MKKVLWFLFVSWCATGVTQATSMQNVILIDLGTTWTDLTGAVDIVGTGSQIEFTDSDTPPKRFYRVKVEMTP